MLQVDADVFLGRCSPSIPPTHPAAGFSVGDAMGVIVGSFIGGLLLLSFAFFFAVRRRNKKEQFGLGLHDEPNMHIASNPSFEEPPI